MKTALDRLLKIGFSEYEARAYTALLKDNPLTAYEIAKNSGIPTSKVYEVIKKLENRHSVQCVHGDRSKMFVPKAPDEFIQSYRETMEDNLHILNSELKSYRAVKEAGYTWHINNYDVLVQKANRMLNTANEKILMLVWPEEMRRLSESLSAASVKGVKIAVVHYGATGISTGEIYRHPPEDNIYSERGVRGFVIVADSKEALNGRISDSATEAIWSMNESLVIMAEDYVRHDIYLMKTMKRFDPLLREKFGDKYEKLRDVFSDEGVMSQDSE